MLTEKFKTTVWAIMMGSFIVMHIIVVPKAIYAAENTVLVFMKIATGVAFLSGIVFNPSAWCTYCAMGTTTGRIHMLLNR